MRELARRRGWIASLVSLFVVGGFVAAPLAASADDKDGGKKGPDVLLVAFGIPKQEKWITQHKAALGVPVSLGIGGSFDVYSGRVKRAPLAWQRLGFEWLYRLLQNPRKIGKVMTLPQFAVLALRQRFLGAA